MLSLSPLRAKERATSISIAKVERTITVGESKYEKQRDYTSYKAKYTTSDNFTALLAPKKCKLGIKYDALFRDLVLMLLTIFIANNTIRR